ncbi:ABC transporter permease [Pseudomonas putida]
MTYLALAPLPARTRWWRHRSVQRFCRNRLAVTGSVILLLLTAACFLGPPLLPYTELTIDLRARFAAPFSGPHLLGTDPLGRDLAARLLMAGRISLLVGFCSMLLSTLAGAAVGIVAGFYGGRIGAVLMRVVDAFLAFPAIFLLLVLAAFTHPSALMITLIIALTSWMEVARVVEAQVRSLREQDYIQAARTLGLRNSTLMFSELLPNAMGPIIVAATLTVGRAILLEAYVSYLGYGIQPPLPSWGNLLNGAQQYLLQAPWLALIPGVAIALAVTSFNFIGDGVRDALDVRSDSR